MADWRRDVWRLPDLQQQQHQQHWQATQIPQGLETPVALMQDTLLPFLMLMLACLPYGA
jgi:hypothetical protein